MLRIAGIVFFLLSIFGNVVARSVTHDNATTKAVAVAEDPDDLLPPDIPGTA